MNTTDMLADIARKMKELEPPWAKYRGARLTVSPMVEEDVILIMNPYSLLAGEHERPRVLVSQRTLDKIDFPRSHPEIAAMLVYYLKDVKPNEEASDKDRR